ncbi:MAG TPA: DUF6491 family protein [Steroidobacteraceae bacterium]|nr:DUF6491 family protein [Steroidobacteraceae bacterium]
MKSHLLAATATLALLQACANVGTTEPSTSEAVALKGEETFIPFANLRTAVHSWETDGIDGMWIEGQHRDWYYAKFLGPCHGVDRSIRLGFDTGTSDKLDRFSYVIVPEENMRCAIESFTASDPPQNGRRRNPDQNDSK